MTANSILSLKCSQMSFPELESLRNLTCRTYNDLIEEAETSEEAAEFKEELDDYLEIIDSIISDRVVGFLSIN